MCQVVVITIGTIKITKILTRRSYGPSLSEVIRHPIFIIRIWKIRPLQLHGRIKIIIIPYSIRHHSLSSVASEVCLIDSELT